MYRNLWKYYPKPLTQVFQTVLPHMSNNLTKRQIVQSIYEGANYNHKHVTEIVQKTLDHICSGLVNGQNVELRNFGVFELQVRSRGLGVTPTNREGCNHSPPCSGQI